MALRSSKLGSQHASDACVPQDRLQRAQDADAGVECMVSMFGRSRRAHMHTLLPPRVSFTAEADLLRRPPRLHVGSQARAAD